MQIHIAGCICMIFRQSFKMSFQTACQANLYAFPSSNRLKRLPHPNFVTSTKPTRSQMKYSLLPTWSFQNNAFSNNFVKSLMFPRKHAQNQEINSLVIRVEIKCCRISFKIFEERVHGWNPKIGISKSVGPQNLIPINFWRIFIKRTTDYCSKFIS